MHVMHAASVSTCKSYLKRNFGSPYLKWIYFIGKGKVTSRRCITQI